MTLASEITILAQKWSKIAARKILLGLCDSLLIVHGPDQFPAAHTGGVIKGGLVVVALGVSDMQQGPDDT